LLRCRPSDQRRHVVVREGREGVAVAVRPDRKLRQAKAVIRLPG